MRATNQKVCFSIVAHAQLLHNYRVCVQVHLGQCTSDSATPEKGFEVASTYLKDCAIVCQFDANIYAPQYTRLDTQIKASTLNYGRHFELSLPSHPNSKPLQSRAQ